MYVQRNLYDDLDNSALSARLIGILKQAGIERLSALYAMTDDAILLIPRVGQFYLREIRRTQRGGL